MDRCDSYTQSGEGLFSMAVIRYGCDYKCIDVLIFTCELWECMQTGNVCLRF